MIRFHSFVCVYSVFPTLLKRLYYMFLAPLYKLIDHICMGLFLLYFFPLIFVSIFMPVPTILIIVLCLVTQSCLTLCNPMDCSLPGSSEHGDSSGKNTGVGCRSFLQGSNPGLPHCRWIYHLSHQGSIL